MLIPFNKLFHKSLYHNLRKILYIQSVSNFTAVVNSGFLLIFVYTNMHI